MGIQEEERDVDRAFHRNLSRPANKKIVMKSALVDQEREKARDS